MSDQFQFFLDLKTCKRFPEKIFLYETIKGIYSISAREILIHKNEVYQLYKENFNPSIYDILQLQAKSLQIVKLGKTSDI